MTRYFVDEVGSYLGGFDGAEPPEGAIEVPTAPFDARLTWNGSGWGTLEDLRDAKLAALAEKRWQVETSGIAISGMPIFTDDRSKLMITGARIKADADANFTTQWVAADGSIVTLAAAQIIGISDAVLAHVDACFARFAVLAMAIQVAADEAALDAIDINADWPPSA